MGAIVANKICFAKITCGDEQRIFAYGRRVPSHKPRAKNEDYRKSGALIAARRLERGLTQEGLAAQLGKKITRQRVQNWEKGVAMPRPPEMRKLAEVLGLSVDEITFGERSQRVQEASPPPYQEQLELTPNGRTIGRIWDDLPQAGQDYIAEQLAAMLRFQSEDRDMAAYVFQKPSTDVWRRLKDHEKLMEMVQDKARRRRVVPPEDDGPDE